MLTNDEKITYLANLYAVARADGSVSPNELRAIEASQKQIKATKTALKKAESLAESSNNATGPMQRLSMNIANLEDMVLVALVDGSLDRAEAPVITGFAKSIGITNDLLKRIVGQAKRVVTEMTATRVCPGCSATAPGDAKFCPDCGDSLTQSDKESAVAITYDIPKTGFTIEFAESTASGFGDAVRKADAAPIHSICVKAKKSWYMAAWPKEQIIEVLAIVRDLKGMRNRKVWVDGEETRWDEVFGFAWCSDERGSAYRPNEYCFGISDKQLNTWGCRQIRMEWNSWADWFSYGSFKKGGLIKGDPKFVFDKKRIRHELETNLFRFRHCPHIDFALIDAVLTSFPDEVRVTTNGPWKYKKDYEHTPGCITVKEKIVDDDYTYVDEYYSSGVVPTSSDVGLTILKEALRSCGRSSSEVKGVLKYRGD